MRNTNNESTEGNKKVISYKEGLALSRHIRAKHYIECSAVFNCPFRYTVFKRTVAYFTVIADILGITNDRLDD
jgi:hypothetical protein